MARMKSRKYLENLAGALVEANEDTECDAVVKTVSLIRFLLGNESDVANVIKAMEKGE
jgi:hypothetical protein